MASVAKAPKRKNETMKRMKRDDPERYAIYLEKKRLEQREYRDAFKRAPKTPEVLAKIEDRRERNRYVLFLENERHAILL